jgi:hypothetical protein
MMKPLNSENATPGAEFGVSVPMPGVRGDALVPEAARRPLRELMDDALLDALLERSRDQAGGLRLTGEGSMLGELVRVVLERALEAELTAHLGYGKSERGGNGNARNGAIAKTVQTGVGPVPLQVPRDRAGTFEPLLVPKRAGRVAGGLDDMDISLYAHGMSVCGRPARWTRFWASVMADLKNRGVRDILIACAGGLAGFGLDSTRTSRTNALCMACRGLASSVPAGPPAGTPRSHSAPTPSSTCRPRSSRTPARPTSCST